MLKYWDIHVKERSPVFQITYGESSLEMKCWETNHINIACGEASRQLSMIRKVFNFSILYYPNNGELDYPVFAPINFGIFSNWFVYLGYKGFDFFIVYLRKE